MKSIGIRLKEERKKLKLTQEQLSEMLGISCHYYYELENGKKNMSMPMLIKIAEVLNLSLDYLVFGFSMPTHTPGIDDSIIKLFENMPSEKQKELSKTLKHILPYLKF